jgi:hypothetical protein
MKPKIVFVFCVFFVSLVFSSLCFSQGEQKGEISGTILDESGEALPGVAITLTGEKLFQKSLSLISNQKGFFRFLALNPGVYALEVSLQGFNTVKLPNVPVSIGRSTPVTINMTQAKLQSEVTVLAKAPLIETKTPQIFTNFNTIQVENTPTSRHFIDIVNAAPGVFDNTAYGASGNVSWGGGGVFLARGSMSSSFRLNGVDVSDPSVGYTTLNPVYESIEEVQITGIGASAEYGSFVGAAINIVTKSGSNKFHGSFTGAYSDSKNFYANYDKVNNQQYYNYAYYWKHDYDLTTTLSGPLIKEKLFFSVAGGRESKWPRITTSTIYQTFDVWRGYAKLDYLLNPKNTLSLMYNVSSADQGNQGLYAAYYDPSVAFHSLSPNHTVFASLNSVLSQNSFVYVKLAGYTSHIKWDPVTRDVPQYTNSSPLQITGGSSMERNVYSSNLEINAAMTYFADELLGMSHELKFGLEYQDGRAGETRTYGGGGSIARSPNADGTANWSATVGGDQDFLGTIKSVRGFVQDNVKVNRHLNLNLGFRYENPRFNARNFSGSGDIASFNAFSPRVGFTYDLTGDQKTAFRGSFGIYYNKPLTGTYYYSFPGNSDRYSYVVTLPAEDFVPTAQNIKDRLALIARPENLQSVSTYSQPIPVDPDLKLNNNYTYNLGFSRQLGAVFAIDFDFIYRLDHNRYHIESSTQHTFSEYQWTDPWLGKTITLWTQVDRLADTNLVFKNSSWAKKRDLLFMIVLKKMPSHNWSFVASYTYQNSKGNLASSGTNDLFGFPSYNLDTDPAYINNPLMYGRQWTRPHQGKILTTYFGPFGINATVDLRMMSGIAWQALVSSSAIPAAQRPYRGTGYPEILLEQRGIRNQPVSWNLNFRLAKSFKIRNTFLEFRADMFNALNAQYYYNVYTNPSVVYSDGTSAFGKPNSLFPPRNTKIGFTWKF